MSLGECSDRHRFRGRLPWLRSADGSAARKGGRSARWRVISVTGGGAGGEVRRHWCQCCHREFSPIRRDAKWCSGPCRWKAYRRRTAARAVEAEREREAAARALERERERARIAQEAARRREDFIASLIG